MNHKQLSCTRVCPVRQPCAGVNEIPVSSLRVPSALVVVLSVVDILFKYIYIFPSPDLVRTAQQSTPDTDCFLGSAAEGPL